MDYLFSLGHQRIGYVGECHNETRYQGYLESFQKHNLNIEPAYVIETKQTEIAGFEVMQKLMQEKKRPTAIYCANDITAIGMLKCLNQFHNRYYRPSIISSDDIEEAENGMNGNCNCYFVVKGDGSVYLCDFYCMDEWKLGTVNEPFQTMLVSERAKAFLSRGSELHEKCNQCPHFTLCRGGCRRWRETGEEGKFDLNYLCPAYEIFFTHCSERIHKLGKMIQQKYGTYQEG